jgi:hypothetical protein
MEAAFDRSERYPERFGALGVIQVLEIVQNDEGSLVGREVAESLMNLTSPAGGERLGFGTRLRRCVFGEFVDVRVLAPPALADQIQRGVDGDPVEPGGKLRLAAEPLQRSERRHEDFLGHVTGVFVVTADPQRDREHAALEPVDDEVEGGGVPAAGAFE